MKDIIVILKQCQEQDIELYAIKQRLADIPLRIASLEEQFDREQAEYRRMEEELKNTKVALKNKENDLKAKEEQIRKYEGQLMQVKTNKEYAALQGEIKLLKQECSAIEEEIIIHLDEIATIEKDMAREKERLQGKKTELYKEKENFQALEKEDNARIAVLTKKRTELLSNVDEKIASLYNRISEKRQGRALSHIDGENCSGCSMRIRPQMINEVRMCDQLVTCDSCSRILYVED